MKREPAEIMVCVSGFAVLATRQVVAPGQRLSADDPLVKKHPRHFVSEHADSAAIHQRRVELGVLRMSPRFGR